MSLNLNLLSGIDIYYNSAIATKFYGFEVDMCGTRKKSEEYMAQMCRKTSLSGDPKVDRTKVQYSGTTFPTGRSSVPQNVFNIYFNWPFFPLTEMNKSHLKQKLTTTG